MAKSTAPRRTPKKPSQAERTTRLEDQMSNVSSGITAIMDRMDADRKAREADSTKPEAGTEITDTPPVPKKVIDLPPSHINLGEINMRRDIADFLISRVKWLDESGQRPGWTVERELEMIVKYTKKTAETTQAAAESREQTLSGADRA